MPCMYTLERYVVPGGRRILYSLRFRASTDKVDNFIRPSFLVNASRSRTEPFASFTSPLLSLPYTQSTDLSLSSRWTISIYSLSWLLSYSIRILAIRETVSLGRWYVYVTDVFTASRITVVHLPRSTSLMLPVYILQTIHSRISCEK